MTADPMTDQGVKALLGEIDWLSAEVDRLRAENARLAAQERASGPETPQGHPSEGTGVPGPHGAAQAAGLTPAEQAAADALMDTIGSSLADTARAVVAAARPHLYHEVASQIEQIPTTTMTPELFATILRETADRHEGTTR